MSRALRVDLVIPVLNEAHVLERSVATVRAHCATHLPYRWRVVIVDNGSTDGTAAVAERLAASHPDDVEALALPVAGRGRALRLAWTRSTADACAYCDVDLSTDLEALRRIFDAVLVEGFDVATGSRLLPGRSQVERSRRRTLLSRGYNLLLRLVLRVRFTDAQCGFKAVSRRAIERIVPQVRDESWFFDTELLVLAERQGYRIGELPVRWSEDDDSRVRILRTVWDDLKGVVRLRLLLWRRPAGDGAPLGAAADATDDECGGSS